MIEVSGLCFSYGSREVIRDLSFVIPRGSLTAVLGCNGAGKSTLFRCILGFLTDYRGNIQIEGDDIRRLSRKEMARRIAYIPQNSDPVFDYTVMDIVLMGASGSLSPFRVPGSRERQTAENALRDLGIWELRDRGVGHISGGERQLAFIARAIAQNARMLIMDEPTANLDFGNQHRVLNKIQELRERDYTILMSTHNPDHALRFAEEILAMYGLGDYASGPTDTVLTAETIEKIYGIDAVVSEITVGSRPVRICIPE